MNEFRSNCPISSALDLVGDKWSLLVVRDMLVFQKSTFKDFESSDEKIATNILSTRLKLLEKSGIVTKHKLKTNKKNNVYLLTEKGFDLADVLLAFTAWSDKYLSDIHPEMQVIKTGETKSEINEAVEQIVVSYKEFRNLQLKECT